MAFDSTDKYAPHVAVAKLTDSSGGTPGATLAAGITDAVAKNAVASLNAQINLIIDALAAAGIAAGS